MSEVKERLSQTMFTAAGGSGVVKSLTVRPPASNTRFSMSSESSEQHTAESPLESDCHTPRFERQFVEEELSVEEQFTAALRSESSPQFLGRFFGWLQGSAEKQDPRKSLTGEMLIEEGARH